VETKVHGRVEMVTKTKTAPLAGLQDPDFDGMSQDLEDAEPASAPPERRRPGRPSVPTRQFTIRVTNEILEVLIDMAYAESKRRKKPTTAQAVVVDMVEKAIRAYRRKQAANG
jgi:hypothetical protein